MSQLLDQSSLLAVGVECDARLLGGLHEQLTLAPTAHEAIQRLRIMRYDLLLTGTAVPDMPWGNMIRRVRSLWPQQCWALLAPQLAVNDEVAARALGAVAILQQWPDADALSALTVRRAAAHRPPDPKHARTRVERIVPA